jgi:capsular exopolysaccharide synthesis family protein
MELQRYLEIFKRRAWVILTVAAVALLIVILATFVLPSVYEAQSTVRVLLDVGVVDFTLREDYSKRLLNTYAEVLQSESMLAKAIERLSLQESSSSLVKEVLVEVVPNTELLTISVQSQDPQLAQNLANILPTLLKEYAEESFVGSSKSTQQILDEQLVGLANDLQEMNEQRSNLITEEGSSTTEIETLTRQIEFKEDAYDRLLDRYELARLNESLRANSVTVVAPADLPTAPADEFIWDEFAIALAIGLLAGIGFALVLENLDTRIHSSQQFESLFSLPVLGSVPRGFISAQDLNLEDAPDNSKRMQEAYRLLCTNLLVSRKQLSKQELVDLDKILITSAEPQEGKSMVAANLARMFAEQGKKVFLVESNLRHPVLIEKFGVDAHAGLGNLLVDHNPADEQSLAKLVCTTDQPGLSLVNSGSKVPNPTALLASPSVEKLLDYLEAQGEITVLDAPPVLGVADVSVLAPKVDGIIMVVRQSLSKRETVSRALKQLKAAQAHVLGIVFMQKRLQE